MLKSRKWPLDPATLQLNVGDDFQLVATITPSDATNQNVTWTSSDNGIATVDDTGKVTALAEGTATITVTTEDGNKTAISVVTVSIPTGTIDTSALDSEIAAANEVLIDQGRGLGTEAGQYPQEAINALGAAITAAETAKVDAETQEEIDGAVEVLKAAVRNLQGCPNPGSRSGC